MTTNAYDYGNKHCSNSLHYMSCFVSAYLCFRRALRHVNVTLSALIAFCSISFNLYFNFGSMLILITVHGGWGGWSTWGTCSSTCGIGLRRRDRACDSPWPSKDGNHCFGDSVDQDICMEYQCM